MSFVFCLSRIWQAVATNILKSALGFISRFFCYIRRNSIKDKFSLHNNYPSRNKLMFSLRENCPDTEFLLVRMQENTDQ